MKVLLVGAGSSRDRRLRTRGDQQATDFSDCELTTLDLVAAHGTDIVFDLNRVHRGEGPLPAADESFDEIHAYEILEHLGSPGAYEGWFREWREWYRVLRPGGLFCGTVPWWQSMWAWADPGHTRCLPPGAFVFLQQKQYEQQVGKTAMSDYREWWPAPHNFDPLLMQQQGENLCFILRKVPYRKYV